MTSVDDHAAPVPEEAGGSEQPLATPPSLDVAVQRRIAEPDAVCAGATGVARTAAEALAGAGEVGDHLGVLAEGERLVTHYFTCLAKGYRGWRWAITVARPPRSRTATVCETALLPGDGAILAPVWVPWSDRLAPGDLGAADVLPYRDDDPLLDPGFSLAGADDDGDRMAWWELGLGRARVLNRLGRDEAAARWYRGDRGPTADEAVHAAAACSTCGYFVPLAGVLRQVFGVCANEWSPSDARVVSVDHGCGAHSETDVERSEPLPLPEPILDETGAEAVALAPRVVDDATVEPADVVVEPGDTVVIVGDTVAEPVGDPATEGVPVPEEVPVPEAVPVPETVPVAEAESTDPGGGDPDSADEPGSAQSEGPADEGEPLPGERHEDDDDAPLVGYGVSPIPMTPLEVGPSIVIGSVDGSDDEPAVDEPER